MAPITTSQPKMAKLKSKGAIVPNKAMHSRASYLYQAATYLATQQQTHSNAATESSTTPAQDTTNAAKVDLQATSESKALLQSASRRLVSDLGAVSLKAQMRMAPAMKHSICKNCDTLLVDGSTCTNEIENKSKGGKKPWADTLVRKCNTCGSAKRYPVGTERQKRRPWRSVEESTLEVKVPEA